MAGLVFTLPLFRLSALAFRLPSGKRHYIEEIGYFVVKDFAP